MEARLVYGSQYCPGASGAVKSVGGDMTVLMRMRLSPPQATGNRRGRMQAVPSSRPGPVAEVFPTSG